MVVVCSALVVGCVGCGSTTSQPVAAPVASKRVYDTAYIPPSLWSKVDTKGDGFIDKSFAVNELMVEGRYIYEVIKDGVANYYDVHGVAVTGAERTRILTQEKARR